MIGGFVLSTGPRLRTLEVFAGCEPRQALYQQVEASGTPHTEVCCFSICAAYRNRVWLNFFVWLCVAYALRIHGTSQLIFGTNSARLAALYSAAPKSRLMHSDRLNHKQTFIFTGPRKDCLSGVAHILCYKIKRLVTMWGGAPGKSGAARNGAQAGVGAEGLRIKSVLKIQIFNTLLMRKPWEAGRFEVC